MSKNCTQIIQIDRSSMLNILKQTKQRDQNCGDLSACLLLSRFVFCSLSRFHVFIASRSSLPVCITAHITHTRNRIYANKVNLQQSVGVSVVQADLTRLFSHKLYEFHNLSQRSSVCEAAVMMKKTAWCHHDELFYTGWMKGGNSTCRYMFVCFFTCIRRKASKK